MRFVADGYDADFIRDNLERDRDNFLTHLDEGQKIYRAIGDCAPAFGMIGTLIGMVQMFANMTDPSKLGPYMAVALLATFYGAAVANLFCLPIADKLHLKLVDEEINRTLIIDGMLMIRDSKSPTLVREMLLAYLPEKHRHRRRAKLAPGLGGGCGNAHGKEESRRSAWRRSRLVRDLRRPDGAAGRFFVMLVAFSTQDSAKLQIVAGSMRDAFGVQQNVRYSGIIEVDGLPTRPKLKNVAKISPEDASATPRPDEKDHDKALRRQAEEGLRPSRWPPRRCGRRCRTCRRSPRSPRTS